MDIVTLVKKAQLALAGHAALTEDNIVVGVYRGKPDFELLDAMSQDFDPEKRIDYHLQDWRGFIHSKPSLDNGLLSVSALCALDDNARDTGELWLKLKSNLAIASENKVEPVEISLQQIQQALLPEGTAAPQCIALDAYSGPRWLKSSVTINAEAIELPFVETPLEDLPQRYTGHFYIKLLSPAHRLFQS